MKFVMKYGKSCAFLAGALSVLGFAPFYVVPCSFVGFSVLMYLLLQAQTKKQLFAYGYWFGFAHFAFGLLWVGNALLIDVAHFGWLYPIVFLASGAFFGVFAAFPALGLMWARQKWQKWMMFASLWVVFEWLRSFVLTGFPWNLTGYTLAFSDELIQGAAFGGTYLLSLFALLLYTVGGLVLSYRSLKAGGCVLTASAVAVAGMWYLGYYRLHHLEIEPSDVVVRVVQPSIPQTMKWDEESRENNFAEYLSMSATPSALKPDFVVWGETAVPFLLEEDEVHRQRAASVLPKDSYLVTGAIRYRIADGRWTPHNSMLVIDSDAEVVEAYDKSHLVPFGEYIPLRKYLPRFIRPVANAIGTFGQGDGPKVIRLANRLSFGGIICYEVIFPHQIVSPKERPDFFINLTNDGWYGHSAGPYQHWVAAKLRAVEEGIAVVRAANNGISGMIQANGREKVSLGLDVKGFFDVELDRPLKTVTIYSIYGNAIILTFCLSLLFLSCIKMERRLNSTE
jgi:apolipoprotein N-acyltransferase